MKWILGAATLLFVTNTVNPTQELQSRYRRVESYEIRPGVLATPKYSGGTLCEIFIEKRHLQGDTVELGPTMPHEMVLQMIDEVVPLTERGRPVMQLAGSDYIDTKEGQIETEFAAYEKVLIEIFKATSDSGDTAAMITWKNVCGSS